MNVLPLPMPGAELESPAPKVKAGVVAGAEGNPKPAPKAGVV